MLNEEYKQKINTFINNNKDYIFSLRHYFHTYPELSGQEYETAKYIEKELDAFNIFHERVGDTGVYAEIDSGKSGKTIMLRADIDALPIDEKNDIPYKSKNNGVMHACGHDVHTTALLSACKFLSDNKNLYKGKIKIAFQQGEEIGLGAKVFIKNGYVKDVDRTFGLHVKPEISVGKILIKKGVNNAAVDMFKIRVIGKSTHISTPEKGVDALYIACNIVETLQALVTKKVNPIEGALIGIGKFTSGTAYNIVSDSAEIEGTVRTFDMKTREYIKDRIINISKTIAENFGGKIDYDWKDNTSVLSNDEKTTLDIQELSYDLFGKENIIIEYPPSLTGDDFAEFSLIAPGTYAYIGCSNKEKNITAPVHSECFNVDEDCILIATKLMIAETLDFLK